MPNSVGEIPCPADIDGALLVLGQKVVWSSTELRSWIPMLEQLDGRLFIEVRPWLLRDSDLSVGWHLPRRRGTKWNQIVPGERGDPNRPMQIRLSLSAQKQYAALLDAAGGQGGEGASDRSKVRAAIGWLRRDPIVSTVIGGLILAAILAWIGLG